jgi:hypothetical protein
VSKSFRTGRLERKLQMVQLSATRCSYIAILRVNILSSAAITLCVASQGMFIIIVVYSVTDSVRKILDTPSYIIDSIVCSLGHSWYLSMELAFVDTAKLYSENYQRKLDWSVVADCCQYCEIRMVSSRRRKNLWNCRICSPAPHESQHPKHCLAWSKASYTPNQE